MVLAASLANASRFRVSCQQVFGALIFRVGSFFRKQCVRPSVCVETRKERSKCCFVVWDPHAGERGDLPQRIHLSRNHEVFGEEVVPLSGRGRRATNWGSCRLRWSVHVREENGGGQEVRGRFVFAKTRLDTNCLEVMIGWRREAQWQEYDISLAEEDQERRRG